MPTELIVVRHGESLGNVAREDAEAVGAETIDLGTRDADVELSDTGRRQARAVGAWLAADPQRRPDAVVSSPYVRARDTARLALEAAGIALPVDVDERLRDRELGVLDRLTSSGARVRHPEEAARRRELGKLYYRPPGGESWADVVLRLRSLLRDLDAYDGRVLVTTHDAVVLLLRYVTERMSEQHLLELAASGSVPNGSITRFVRADDGRGWRTAEVNAVGHLEDAGVEVTTHGTEGHRVHAG